VILKTCGSVTGTHRSPTDPGQPPAGRAATDAPAPPAARRPVLGPSWWLRDPNKVPPPRPSALTARELGFEPQRATRWFSPGVLTRSGLKVGVTSVFGSFLDKRELQYARPAGPDLRYAHRDELWIDYVADTGDGFDATATVAWHVAQAELSPEGVDTPLPRGDILVLGGDEVYPAASTEGYEARLEGPWRAALPWTDARTFDPAHPQDPGHPTVYAVPGNHDWYDGLTGFLRMFGQARWLGGWRTQQTRSYFAVQLPHRWWLWGIDIQADTLVDEPQLEFFSEVAKLAEHGDRLVLATAVPTWTDLERDPHAYRNLAFLERTLMRPRGIELTLTVAGDLHHYARYTDESDDAGIDAGNDTGNDACIDPSPDIGPTHKITSGGGGAFLHPTHHLPKRARIGIWPDQPDEVVEYTAKRLYPPPARSRRLSLAALLLPLRNPSFLWVPGIANLALLWTIQFGLRSLSPSTLTFAEAAEGWSWSDLLGGIFRNSLSAIVVIVLLGGLWAFARTPPWAAHNRYARYAAKTVLAAVHGAAQIAAIATVALVSVRVASLFDGWLFPTVASIVAFVVGAVACSLVLGAYLAAAIGLPGVRTHPNDSFAAARLESHKNFLRMHIDRDGALTVRAIGIDRTVKWKDWHAVPVADTVESSWIEPAPHARPRAWVVDEVTIP
jgi:Calcineurin-like phosphoesterase